MKWIIDTDPGIDDAAAIIASLNLGILDVIGITSVHGNVELDFTTRNALRLVELMGSPVPVFRGTEQGIVEPPRRAALFHGKDGFGDVGLPDPEREAETTHAVDFMVNSAHTWKGQLSVLTLGPLTNLAVAIAKERAIAQKISRVVMMGGTSRARGNTTPLAEFNVYADPEAAQAVLLSGIPVTVIPWETCVDAVLGPQVVSRVRESCTPVGQAFSKAADLVIMRLRERLGVEGLLLCDLVAACVAMDPSCVVERQWVRMEVETGGRMSRGLTVVDERLEGGLAANVELCTKCDAKRVGSMFIDALDEQT